MKRFTHLLACAFFAWTASLSRLPAANWMAGMQEGKAACQSMGPLAFGPDGILFVADTKAAAVVAIATGDTKPAGAEHALKIESINTKIAALLGTAADQLLIEDIAVNPISRQVYLAVSRGRGPEAVPVLVRVTAADQLETVSLDKVRFSRAELPDAPVEGVTGQGNRQSNPRRESITDLGFLEDRVLIAGLSNEEFASTLRAIPFPFRTVANGTSVEIYHGAHGRFETRAPVRTFVPFTVGTRRNFSPPTRARLSSSFPSTPSSPAPRSKARPSLNWAIAIGPST